jgi:hypothetical protein
MEGSDTATTFLIWILVGGTLVGLLLRQRPPVVSFVVEVTPRRRSRWVAWLILLAILAILYVTSSPA